MNETPDFAVNAPNSYCHRTRLATLLVWLAIPARACMMLCLLMLSGLLLFPQPSQAQAAGSKSLFVTGYVYVRVRPDRQKTRDIALPNASVSIAEFGSPIGSDPIAVTRTDLSGRFILKTQKKGLFQVCVKADGFNESCSGREFFLDDKSFRFGKYLLNTPRERNEAVASLHGELTLRDGSNPRTFQPFMSVNERAKVDLNVGGNLIYSAYVNNFGEYVLPAVPIKEDFDLSVAVGDEVVTRRIQKETSLKQNRDHSLDISLFNTPPELRHVSASVNDEIVQEVLPGQVVVVSAVARDVDDDKLSYLWQLPDDSLEGPSEKSVVEWLAPARKGNYAFSVLVSDSRGGTVRDSFVLTVGDDRIPFSGTVVDFSGAPIAGAQVTVNDRLVASNSKGRFRIEVPVADRYAMTIRKDGVSSPSVSAYGTASFVYTKAVMEGRWTLRRAQVFTVNPGSNIVLRQAAKFRDCGSKSETISWERYLNERIFQWQDGNGRVMSLRDIANEKGGEVEDVSRILSEVNPSLAQLFERQLRPKGRRGDDPDDGRMLRLKNRDEARCRDGIQIEIPANSLVDSRGNKPAGKVRIALSSIDVNASQMPGDLSATDESDAPVSMESFGAGSIEIGDGVNKYNLAPGASAIVSIPVDRSQIAGGAVPDSKIPFLYFNERTAIWEQDGMAELTGSGANAMYQKKVSHFSTLNADILKSDQSCVAVEVDSGAGFTFPLDVEVTLQPSVVAPTVIQVRTLTIASTSLLSNVIYNLPNDSEVALTPIVEGERPDGSTGSVPAGVFIVNTGGPQTGASNLPVANPDGTYYAEVDGVATGPCGSRVVLTNLLAPQPASGYEFLQGLFLQYSSNISELDEIDANQVRAGSAAYYEHADPRDLRNSFVLFKQQNRFEDSTGNPVPLDIAAGEGEFEAEFANSGDLGFGRDMHCRKNIADDGQFDYACYVTNYGQPPADLVDQLDADNAHDGINPDATVAMEYSRIEDLPGIAPVFPNNERAVKFFVYGADPNGLPVTEADLDDFGERPIPQLCMMCHGGASAATPIPGTNATAGAFAGRSDILSMGSSFLPFDLSLYNFPTLNSKAAQQVAFKNLNEQIVNGVATATDAAGSTGSEIIDLIAEFYSGADPDVQVDEPVVAGWDAANPGSDTNRFYRQVLAPSCRTCHIAQPYAAPAYDNSADFHIDIGTVQSRVCNEKVMPHARRTHEVFWQSIDPNMPAFLQMYGQTIPGWSDLDTAQCGQFYQGGSDVVSVFSDKIYPILVNRCQGCHSTVGNANFEVSNAVDTYNSILTANSFSSDPYIDPGNIGNSILYQRLLANGGSLMPQGGPVLNTVDDDADGVVDLVEFENWISTNAPGP